MLALMTAIVFLALSNTSFALAPNPGATCEGIADASQGSLTNADYSNLVSAVNTNNYVTIAGNAAGSAMSMLGWKGPSSIWKMGVVRPRPSL